MASASLLRPPAGGAPPRRRRVAAASAAFLLLAYCILGHFQLVTPVPDLPELLPMIAASLLSGAGPPVPLPCAPCGCAAAAPRAAGPPAAGTAAAAAAARGAPPPRAPVPPSCLPDDELAFLSSLDAPLLPAASAAQAAQLRAAAEDRLDAPGCYARAAGLRAAHAASGGAGASARGHVLWHWYVRSDLGGGDLTRAQAAALAAWGATQDVGRATLVVWLPPPAARPPPALAWFAAAMPGRVRWRLLDVRREAEGTPLARAYQLGLADGAAWADSDVARLVLLWRYGGVWTDTDMLLTAPLTPLLGAQFATEFSCDHGQGDFNNAIMRFFPRSAAAAALAAAARAKWPRLRQWTYGPHTLRAAYDAGAPFTRTPWCFFHGRWCAGGVDDAALAGDGAWPARALDGAFGLHLHGAGSRGARRVFNGSILAVGEARAHEGFARALAEGRAGAPGEGAFAGGPAAAAAAWRARAVPALAVFPPGHVGAWADWDVPVAPYTG